MKKIALLTILALVFSLTCVFATEGNNEDLLVAPLVATEQILEGTSEPIALNSGELESAPISITGEPSNEISNLESGEQNIMPPADDVENDIAPAPVEDEENDIAPAPVQDTEETTSNSSENSAIVGAIIAIVIVIAVVAISAILRKD